MTKTPVVQRFALSARLSRTGKASLTEPFLSNKDGKVHTTGAIERSSMCERWLVLVHASFFMACNYYCYDIPAALYRPLGHAFWFERNFEYYFDMLYSIYSVPNIILPLFGGLLIDKVGLYFSLKLFSALLLAGQMTFALGCTISSLPLMLVGRFVFGLGGESISVAQSALIERWFSKKELGLALGASLSISRLGSVINNALSPAIASATYNVSSALWLGVVLCGLAWLSCVYLSCLDSRVDSRLRMTPGLVIEPSPPPIRRFELLPAASPLASPEPSVVSADGRPLASAAPNSGAPNSGVPNSGALAGASVDHGTKAARDVPCVSRASAGALDGPLDDSSGRSGRSSVRSLLAATARDVATFPRPYWLIVLLCVVIYGAVLPFNNIASALLLDRDFFPQGSVWRDAPSGGSGRGGATAAARHNHTFVYDGHTSVRCHTSSGGAWRRGSAYGDYCASLASAQTSASLVMSEPYVLSAALTPCFGWFVDAHGGRAALILLSSAILTASHLGLALSHAPATVLLVGIGVGYAAFASVIWPAIPSVVGRAQLGTAYGLVTTAQNLGLFALPLLVGLVLDISTADAPSVDPNPYQGVEIFFACLGAFGFLCGLLLNSDEPTRIALNTPGGTIARGYTPSPSPMATPSVTRRGANSAAPPGGSAGCSACFRVDTRQPANGVGEASRVTWGGDIHSSAHHAL